MIHLMLDQFRKRAGRIQFFRFRMLVQITNTDGFGSFEPHEQIRKRETVVPQGKPRGAHILPLGVDQAIRRSFELHVDDAFEHADLHGADSPPKSVATLKIVQCIAHVMPDARR